ncbi:ThuA domain-containing protein [Salinimicrobium sp. GXAS 041]|uniref:ThuA domain-containing protein n=1 Tax=Salinimicrobium sp. GXAS 041 TaxID=3400806 RepID=UPI003C72E524
MRYLFFFFFLNLTVLSAQEPEVLVFHKTNGWYHESIPKGVETFKDLGEEHGFSVTATNDAQQFSEAGLEKFDLVVFLNTTGDVLNEEQQKVFENYMNKGGNFFGIHSAADTEYDWPWYGKLLGAYFVNHPAVQEAEVQVVNKDHPMVAHLPESWKRTDEWYNYKEINPDIEVLMLLNEASYEGGENQDYHPIAWYRELDGGGKAIYTGGGHTNESYDEEDFKEHLLKSIFFAIQD